MRPLLTTTLAATLGAACGSPSHHAATPSHHAGGHHHAFTDAEAWTQVFDDPSRDAWQHPDEVLRALELEPAMVVADVGAGTGYFSVRLARAVPNGEVLATDLEPDMVRFLGERANREQLSNLRPVLATEDASGLAPNSVDRILVVHVWHHLAARSDYARHLATALRQGGRLVIVDFTLTGHRGPPATMRLAPEVIVAELESAGLTATVSPLALPDQYIVEGRKAL